MITITPDAAEQVRALLSKENKPNLVRSVNLNPAFFPGANKPDG